MLTPPKPRLPPLNALRAFEAASRLGGFKAAAAELAVTPGAVAQHIKSLENWAGAPLFERMSQGVRLTALGAAVSADFGAAFDRLGVALNQLRAGAGLKQINIAVLPSIAQLWLSPRLPALRAALPETTVSITALDRPPNLLREPYDLAIFFCREPIAPYQVEICRDRIYPVCAPTLVQELSKPADLSMQDFLHDGLWSDLWQQWLAEFAPGLALDSSGATFSLYALALQEAQNGAGALIGHEPLVRASLDDGSLVAPFEQTLELPDKLVVAAAYELRIGEVLEKIVNMLQGSA